MNSKQLIDEINRYISDDSYNYAILIDGEWGSGKTYFITTECKNDIEKKLGNSKKIIYISLYGCKSVYDIQEKIVYEIFDVVLNKKVKKEKIYNKSKKIISVSKSLGKSLINVFPEKLQKMLSREVAGDIINEFIKIKNYIFIFDDLERCDCKINELFGYFNDLVEHEEAKVIIVANEEEMIKKKIDGDKALQYLVSLNDKIIIPDARENALSRLLGKEESKKEDISPMDLENLEYRRNYLFKDNEDDEVYKQIREKVIGLTLIYKPDLYSIMKSINSNTSNDICNYLNNNIDRFINEMERKGHHNLRTYQFYISRLKRLYNELEEICIDDDHRNIVMNYIVGESFSCAIDFKANITYINKYMGSYSEISRRKSETIKRYIEKGDFNREAFRKEIDLYIEEEVRNKLSDDDPLVLLEQQWYMQEQEWVDEKIYEICERIKNNRYPLFIYNRILLILEVLINIGFDENIREDIMKKIINSINNIEVKNRLLEDVYMIENEEIKQKYLLDIKSINDYIDEQILKNNVDSIKRIINEEGWIDKLVDYTKYDGINYKEVKIFSEIEVSKWVEKILKSSSKELCDFRTWLQGFSKVNMNKDSYNEEEIKALVEIEKQLKTDKINDLIKKNNIKYLKEDINRIVSKIQHPIGVMGN